MSDSQMLAALRHIERSLATLQRDVADIKRTIAALSAQNWTELEKRGAR